MTSIRVEFYGVARARAGRDAVEVPFIEGATLGDVLSAVVEIIPALTGSVIGIDGRSLAEGSIASLDGERFLRDPDSVIPEGRPVLLLPAASGG